MANKTYRHQYAIGDIQGCYGALMRLLTHLDFDEKQDRLWFAGDLVARGEDSLSVLRLIKQLNDTGAAMTVLGNHDLNLLAVWRGFAKIKPKDNTYQVLLANDADELMHWLRQQPLIQLPDENSVMCHAGLPPIWTIKQAQKLALEVQAQLQADIDTLDELLPRLYGKTPVLWQDSLKGYERLRCITNYLTRMRLCTKNGTLEFDFKGNINAKMPANYKPWFSWSVKRHRRILFGHWASLDAKISTNDVRSLDAGCVWGGQLLAYRLADKQIFTVDSP